MNCIFKLVWNNARGMYVVASEIAKNYSAGGRVGKTTLAALMAISLGSGVSYAELSEITPGEGSGIAIGKESFAGDQAVAIGETAKASGRGAVAVGNGAKTEAEKVVESDQIGEIVPEYNTQYGKADDYEITEEDVGRSYVLPVARAIAFGEEARAATENSLAMGAGAQSTGRDALAVGNDAKATGIDSMAIGRAAKATRPTSFALGNKAEASGNQSFAIGPSARATEAQSFAVGAGASAYGGDTVVGYQAGKDRTVATRSKNSSGVLLGYQAGFQAKETTTAGVWGTIYIGQHAGQSSVGAANIFVGSTAGQHHTGFQNILIGDNAKPGIFTTTSGETKGNRNVIIGNQYFRTEKALPVGGIDDTIVIGTLAKATTSQSIAIGGSRSNKTKGAYATGVRSIAVGVGSDATKDGARAEGDDGIAFGTDARAAKAGGVAFGAQAVSYERDGVALGAYSSSERNAGIYEKAGYNPVTGEATENLAGLAKKLGKEKEWADAQKGVDEKKNTWDAATAALADARKSYEEAVEKNKKPTETTKKALSEAETKLREAEEVWGEADDDLYRATSERNKQIAPWKGTASAVAVGDEEKGVLRQITGVAAGSELTDAVNVAQLKVMNEKMDENMIHYFSVRDGDGNLPSGNYNNDGAYADHAIAIGPESLTMNRYDTALGVGAVTGEAITEEEYDALPDEKKGVFQKRSYNVRDYSGTGPMRDAPYKTVTEYFRLQEKPDSDSPWYYGSSLAIGENARANGMIAQAIGLDALAKGQGAIAVGWDAEARSDYQYAGSIAVGNSAFSDIGASAFGNAARAKGEASTAVGTGAEAYGEESFAGGGAYAEGRESVAIGVGATGSGSYSTIIGSGSQGELGAAALGHNSMAAGSMSTVIGSIAVASGSYSVANGSYSSVDADYGSTLGYLTSVAYENDGGTAIGAWSSSTRTKGNYGYNPATGESATDESALRAAGSMMTTADLENFRAAAGTAWQEYIDAKNAMEEKMYTYDPTLSPEEKKKWSDEYNELEAVITSKVDAWKTAQRKAGNLVGAWQSQAGAVSVGDEEAGITRQITNVAAGKELTDAVNVAQLQTVNQKIEDARTESGKHTVVTVNGGKEEGNLKRAKTEKDGQTTYDIQLSDIVTLPGKASEDAVILGTVENGANAYTGLFIQNGGASAVSVTKRGIAVVGEDISNAASSVSIGAGAITVGETDPQAVRINIGKQTATKSNIPETGNYITGLQNKTWDGNAFVSGRAATEDQLRALDEKIGDISDASAAGRTEVAAGDNITIQKETDNTTGKTTYTVHAKDTKVTSGTVTYEGDGTGTLTLTQSDGSRTAVTGLANTYTTGGTYDKENKKIVFNRNNKEKAYEVDMREFVRDMDGKIEATKVTVKGDETSGVKVTPTTDKATTYIVSLDDRIQVGNVVIDGMTGKDGDKEISVGTVTGLTNIDWDGEHYTSGRAATEDQLRKAIKNAEAAAQAGDTHIWAGEYRPEEGTIKMDIVDGKGDIVTQEGKPQQVVLTDIASKTQQDLHSESILNLGNRVGKLDSKVNKAGAGAAALAALHPLDFDPEEKWDFAAGFGNYHGENAGAIGAYYRPNEDTMFSLGGTFGNGENMVNAGISFKLGQGNHVSTSRTAMAQKIEAQDKWIRAQNEKIEKVEKENAEMKEIVRKILEEMEKLKQG